MKVHIGLNSAAFPRIKVCGMTRVEELQYLSEAGVDAVGINLVSTSKRQVGLQTAQSLALAARSYGMSVVAVMMNPGRDFLSEASHAVQWDFIQLHGQEEPDLAELCNRVPIIKAIACSGRANELDLAARWVHWSEAVKANPPVSTREAATGADLPSAGADRPRNSAIRLLAGLLVDAYAPVQGGGTGRTARWDLLTPRPKEFGSVPILLAGGLTPENVQTAILMSRCDGVDTASGVEISPGGKSQELVARFAEEARSAFRQLKQELH